MDAKEAIAELKLGNQRFQEATANNEPLTRSIVPNKMHSEQKPFAVILGCSDSRVPAELVFDQGLGDLFVIRVAGNIVAPSQIASVEFACQKFGTNLVVVMGHTQCGAIAATVDALDKQTENLSPNLEVIVNFIGPAVAPVLNKTKSTNRDELIRIAGQANIRQSVTDLQTNSQVIQDLVTEDKLTIVGAEYQLESGEVGFLD